MIGPDGVAAEDTATRGGAAVPTHARSGSWTEPGAYEVHSGVYRIPLPLPNDGLRAVNVYALREPDGLILIDSGWAFPGASEHLQRALGSIGHDLADIHRILVTHVHRDHYTQAVQLRRLVGSRVSLGAGERPGLQLLNSHATNAPLTSFAVLRRAGAAELARRIAAVLREDFDPGVWEEPDEWLGPGDLVAGSRTLRVVPTPGHTRGHVVFLDAEAGLLFGGDHVLPHITPSIGFELAPAQLPLGDYLDSLHLMTTLADARLLPAHGPVAPSVHGRVGELLAHHEERLAQAERIALDGANDAYEVAQRLTWTRRRVPLTELDDFNRMLAVSETVAHLDLLVARGRLECTENAGVARYTPPRFPSAGRVGR
jgi:glyoxylase-like metal-dependent hydrolase (beta-lactamase superfamily II)